MRFVGNNISPILWLSGALWSSGVASIPCNGTNHTAADIPQRVEALLSKMTFLEKLAQMRNYDGVLRDDLSYDAGHIDNFFDGNGAGSISFGARGNPAYAATAILSDIIQNITDKHRLGIPPINVADSVNGITVANGTLFPASISMGQFWNVDLFSEVVDVMSRENRAIGIQWVLSPELDLAREPRYGRVGEMYGEDWYHVSQYGIAYVDSMQAVDAKGFVRCATTLKHWVYGSGLSGINEAPIVGGLNDLWNIHVAPYVEVFEKTNPLAIMPSYSSYDQVPMHSNIELTRDIIRDDLGFDGVMISDWAGITQLHTYQFVARDIEDAGLQSLRITIDHEIGPWDKSGFGALADMEDDPEIVDLVDQAARRMLYLKFITKTFEEPVPNLNKINSTLRSEEHMEVNKKITRESMVLLKNDGILPLSGSLLDKVAVIGPLADVINPGHYAGSDYKTGSTILDGIRGISDDVTHSVGCFRTNFTRFEEMKAEAVAAAKAANVAVVALGSASVHLDPSNQRDRTDGEGFDHASLEFPGPQPDLLQAIVETGTPVILVANGGQVFTMEYAVENAHGIIHTFLQGEVGGEILGEILTGKTNPSGKLSISIPKTSFALPVYYNHLPMERKAPAQTDSDWQFPQMNRTARYPFGYGLSYTTFSITNVKTSSDSVTLDGEVSISARITNSGDREGKEVVQLYFRQRYPAIERPIKNLIRFEKVSLASGESKVVTFIVPATDLGYWVNGKRRVDSDVYTFSVGSSSHDVDLTALEVMIT